MYKQIQPAKTGLKVNKSYKGESLEQKINRIVNNKEPIKDGAPLIYTERKNGVNPAMDIRTDRFEVAIEKMDYVARSYQAQRDNRIGEAAKEGMAKEKKGETETKNDGGPESTQTTEPK